jgi:hypothetical protein
MIGFKLNSTGDIESSGGEITLLSTVQEAVRQRLDIKLKTFQGEWFLDTTFGIPYRQQIIGKGLTIAERDALYIKAINDDPDVNSIVYFNSTFNPSTRFYSVQFEVRVDDELLRAATANLLPSEEIEYPEPDNYPLQPSCDIAGIFDWSCKLHHIVHCDLPPCGDSTWVYEEGNGSYVVTGYVVDGYVVEYKTPCGDSAYVDKNYVVDGYVVQYNDFYSDLGYTFDDYMDSSEDVSGYDCVKYYDYDYASYDYVGFDCDDETNNI